MKSLKEIIGEALPPLGGVAHGGVQGKEFNWQWSSLDVKELKNSVDKLYQITMSKDPKRRQDLLSGQNKDLINRIEMLVKSIKDGMKTYEG